MCVGCGIGNIPKPGNGASEYEVVGFCLGAQLYKIWLYIFNH